MRYFKVMRGFGSDDFIPIDETELEKAIYAHMVGKPAAFNNGSINGAHISAVVPDWHRAMGWNYGYRLQAEDWNEVRARGLERGYSGAIGAAKEAVAGLIKSGRIDLLGRPDHPERLKLAGEEVR